MIIFGIYFITNDGRLFLREIFQKNDHLPSEFMLSGLLASFKIVSEELTDTFPQSLIMDDVSYHFENQHDFFIVIVTDTKDRPVNLLYTLSMKFMSRYGHLLMNWPGRLEMFEDFKKTILDEISKYSIYDEYGTINPLKRLDIKTIVTLDVDLKPVALELLSLGTTKLEDLWIATNESGETQYNLEEIKEKLTILQNMGYVGQKSENGELYYFT